MRPADNPDWMTSGRSNLVGFKRYGIVLPCDKLKISTQDRTHANKPRNDSGACLYCVRFGFCNLAQGGPALRRHGRRGGHYSWDGVSGAGVSGACVGRARMCRDSSQRLPLFPRLVIRPALAPVPPRGHDLVHSLGKALVQGVVLVRELAVHHLGEAEVHVCLRL